MMDYLVQSVELANCGRKKGDQASLHEAPSSESSVVTTDKDD